MSKISIRKGALERAIAVGTAFALSSTCAATALAADGQTSSGETSLIIKLADTKERGGTSAPSPYENPDTDADGFGDNLAFTVPVSLDFVATPDGVLRGPSADVAFIKNESRYGARVSSLQVTEKNSWHIESDAMSKSTENVIDIAIGPDGDQLDAAQYKEKKAVARPAEWNMKPKGDSDNGDRVSLKSSGHMNNATANIGDGMAFGQINWYVTPGNAS